MNSLNKNILKTDIIKSGMVDHYLMIGTRKANAWCILERSEKVVEMAQIEKLRNRDTVSMREAPKDYYGKQIIKNENNPQKMWKTINEVLGKTAKSTWSY